MSSYTTAPERQGLYDPAFEHDACGVAFVAKLDGKPSHDLVLDGLTALANLDHRGATGADAAAGDGAGILVQVPDEFLRGQVDFPLPPAGEYAVGIAFLQSVRRVAPQTFAWRAKPYEFVAEIPAIDLLAGDDKLRRVLEADGDLAELAAEWAQERAAFEEMRRKAFLY